MSPSATQPVPIGIEVRGLSVVRHQRRILEDVNLDAPRGAVTAIIGPNGSGKTTLLKAIAGLGTFQGSVHIDGCSAGSPGSGTPRIGYVPQRTLLETPFSVERVVALGRFAGRSPFAALTHADREAIERALERSSTTALRARDFTTLSGGERQRVLLARALATGANTLLLDEPTSAQDIAMGLTMTNTLRELATAGATVLVVLHNLAEAREVADHAVLLKAGRVTHRGSGLDITRREPVLDTFGVEVLERASIGLRLAGPHAVVSPTSEVPS